MNNNNNNNKTHLDLLPFMAEAFSVNPRIYKLIDKTYNTDKIRFIAKAKKINGTTVQFLRKAA